MQFSQLHFIFIILPNAEIDIYWYETQAVKKEEGLGSPHKRTRTRPDIGGIMEPPNLSP